MIRTGLRAARAQTNKWTGGPRPDYVIATESPSQVSLEVLLFMHRSQLKPKTADILHVLSYVRVVVLSILKALLCYHSVTYLRVPHVTEWQQQCYTKARTQTKQIHHRRTYNSNKYGNHALFHNCDTLDLSPVLGPSTHTTRPSILHQQTDRVSQSSSQIPSCDHGDETKSNIRGASG